MALAEETREEIAIIEEQGISQDQPQKLKRYNYLKMTLDNFLETKPSLEEQKQKVEKENQFWEEVGNSSV